MKRIYSWNVNGIRAVLNKGEFQKFLKTYNPDFICLQETKAQKAQVPVDFPEYYEYWSSAEKKGYSGTAIFSKEEALQVRYSLPEDIIKQYALTDTYGDLTTEGRVIAAEYTDFYLISVYTPNAKGDLTRLKIRTVWDDAFRAYMKQLDKEKPVIFCGDLNVAHTEDDLARPKDNKRNAGFTEEERTGITEHLSSGFTDTFRLFTQGNGYYTWWSHWGQARARNVGWRIDYVIVSNRFATKIKKAEIHNDQMGSDHCPVSVDIS